MEPFDVLLLFNSVVTDSIKGTEEEYLAFTQMYRKIEKVEGESIEKTKLLQKVRLILTVIDMRRLGFPQKFNK